LIGSGAGGATSFRRNPAKLSEMQALFLKEAAKYNVFPLDNSGFVRLLTPRPSAVAGRTVFTYSGENSGIPVGNAKSDWRVRQSLGAPAWKRSGSDGCTVVYSRVPTKPHRLAPGLRMVRLLEAGQPLEEHRGQLRDWILEQQQRQKR